MGNNEASKLKAEKLSSLYLDAVRVAFQHFNLAVERLGFESLVDEIIRGAISDLKRGVAQVENCFLRDCYELKNVTPIEYPLTGTGLAIRFSPILYVQRLSGNEFKVNAGMEGCLHLRDVDQLIKGLPQFRTAFEEVAEVENVEEALNNLGDSIRQWLEKHVFLRANEPNLCTQWQKERVVVYREFSLSGIKQPELKGEDIEHNARTTVDRSILVQLIWDRMRSIREKVDDMLEGNFEDDENSPHENGVDVDKKFIWSSFVEEMAYDFLIGYLKKSFNHLDGFVKMLANELGRQVIYKYELLEFLLKKWLK
jgi:hypothetical protein